MKNVYLMGKKEIKQKNTITTSFAQTLPHGQGLAGCWHGGSGGGLTLRDFTLLLTFGGSSTQEFFVEQPWLSQSGRWVSK